MHTYQLTSLALVAFSTITNGNPIQGPVLSSVLSSFVAVGTVSSHPPLATGGHHLGHGPVVTHSNATLAAGGSFAMTGAASSCKVKVANLPMCSSGEATLSNKASCASMKKEELGKPVTLKCSEDVKAWVTLKKGHGKMTFSYDQGVQPAHGNGPHGTGAPKLTATQTTTQSQPTGLNARHPKLAPRIVQETQHCRCSTPLASDKTCSHVECWTLAKPEVVNGGVGPQPMVQ